MRRCWYSDIIILFDHLLCSVHSLVVVTPEPPLVRRSLALLPIIIFLSIHVCQFSNELEEGLLTAHGSDERGAVLVGQRGGSSASLPAWGGEEGPVKN
jgi:hypothetical protein